MQFDFYHSFTSQHTSIGRYFMLCDTEPMKFLGIILGGLLCNPTTASFDTFQQTCQSFLPQRYITNLTNSRVEYIPAGTNLSFPENDQSCNRRSQIVAADLCRIALSVSTSNRSSIVLETWLPRKWSGRFIATGNGGLDGCIKYEDLAYTSQYSFAVVGTNNGHNGTSGAAFFNNPDTVTDFAWRSLHTGVLVGKELVRQFYKEPHDFAYYIGCSLGGRQGIKSAEMFPEDFDGMVVGAPAVDFNNLVSWRASFYPITGPSTSADFIPPTAWRTWIHSEILNQCDQLDGVEDEIIEDPSLCQFNPSTLLCSEGSNSTDCLSASQVEIVKKVFRPFMYPNGTLIYPAMQPGSEIYAVDRLYAGKPFSYSDDWFKYVVYQNLSWDASSFTYNDAYMAETLNPSTIRTFPTDLLEYRGRGGKIIAYHGLQDNQISSFNTNRFYHRILNGTNSSATQLDEWFRYFGISGMFHCIGGPGAWVIGQGGGISAVGSPWNGTNNVLKAVVDWVENGLPPETIEGVKYLDDQIELGVSIKRRHCRYPKRNAFLGGNSSLPDSWQCI